MIGLLFRIFEHALMGTCLTSISIVFFSLATLLRLLPRFFVFLWFCLRGLLILSFRLYHLIISRTNPFIQIHLGVNILAGIPHLLFCVLLSTTIWVLILLLTWFSLPIWSITLPILHGLTLGLFWDEFEKPGGLRLGIKIQ